MDKQKLMYQLFIGKISETIGHEKTIELLREAKTAIDSIEPSVSTDEDHMNRQHIKYELMDKFYKFMKDELPPLC